tara:strand:- start:20 stop:274 length:255 start_codon:yes stop_codon:yes gene_type:complete
MTYNRTKKHSFKDDDEASPVTLIMRQYYGNENWKLRNQKFMDRYKNDEEFREYKRRNALLSYYRRKAKRLEEQNESATKSEVTP